MEQTSYPYVRWLDFPQPDGSGRSHVVEDVRIGSDLWHNRGELTEVPLFSSFFRPTRFRVAGPQVIGFRGESDGGEYAFHALFEGVATGETVRISVWLEGAYTGRWRAGLYTEDSYRSDFAWVGPHLQRIVFPRQYRPASAVPSGGVIGQYRGYPSIVWRRAGPFAGEVTVRFAD